MKKTYKAEAEAKVPLKRYFTIATPATEISIETISRVHTLAPLYVRCFVNSK